MLERPFVLPWAVAAAAAFAFVTLCLLLAPEGRVSAWALAASALSAALTAAAVLNAVTRDQLARYRARHKPLAGPRRGARLPR
jgi:ABC-type cobalamin transport system permease subunit